MPGVSRFCSAQSAETSAVSRLIGSLPVRVGGESAHGVSVAPRAGPSGNGEWISCCTCDGATADGERARNCSALVAPSEDGATQAGGHAAQVDRAPLGEQGAHE